jgi:hypothetical protein
VSELRAELHGKRARVAVPRQDASANPISCFDNKHFRPSAMQFAGGGQAGRSRTNNKDIRVSHPGLQ